MGEMEKNEKGEIMVLGHDAWPGFKKAFGVIFVVSCIYLAAILYFSLQHLPGGH